MMRSDTFEVEYPNQNCKVVTISDHGSELQIETSIADNVGSIQFSDTKTIPHSGNFKAKLVGYDVLLSVGSFFNRKRYTF